MIKFTLDEEHKGLNSQGDPVIQVGRNEDGSWDFACGRRWTADGGFSAQAVFGSERQADYLLSAFCYGKASHD